MYLNVNDIMYIGSLNCMFVCNCVSQYIHNIIRIQIIRTIDLYDIIYILHSHSNNTSDRLAWNYLYITCMYLNVNDVIYITYNWAGQYIHTSRNIIRIQITRTSDLYEIMYILHSHSNNTIDRLVWNYNCIYNILHTCTWVWMILCIYWLTQLHAHLHTIEQTNIHNIIRIQI